LLSKVVENEKNVALIFSPLCVDPSSKEEAENECENNSLLQRDTV